MAGVESASARLRKTFRYPSDDELSQGSRDEIDEEGTYTGAMNLIPSPPIPLQNLISLVSRPNIHAQLQLNHHN